MKEDHRRTPLKVRIQLARIVVALLAVILIASVCKRAFAENILTLEECYQMALIQSETLAIQDEELKIAEAHYLEALGTVLPQISVAASEFLQHSPAGSSGNSNNKPQVAINYSQTLFQGLREFRAMKMSRLEKNVDELTWARAKQLLFSDVANAYFTAIEMEKQLSIQEVIRTTLQKRIVELRARVDLGKTRQSELLSAESQLSAVEGDMATSRGLVLVARDLLGFLVGREVKDQLVDRFAVPKTPPPVSAFLDKVSARPDIEASEKATSRAEADVSYEKGLRLPTLGVSANYYPYKYGYGSIFEDNQFTIFGSNMQADALFTFNLPIFTGGTTKGLIKEATTALKQTQLQQQLVFRRAETDIRQAYNTFQTSCNRDKALEQALAQAKQGYVLSETDNRMGLVSNLDVLQTLKDWQQNWVAENLAHYQMKMNFIKLKVAEGDLALPEREAATEQ